MTTDKNKKSINKSGFTLAELMLVVAIVAIMSTVALVSLNGSRERKSVETAAREVAAALREAQAYALTGKGVNSQCTSYAFSATSASAYQITLSGSVPSCTSTILGSYALKNNVTFTTSSPAIFSSPHGTISGGSHIQYVLSKGSTSYTVCACTSGRIEEKESQVTCSTIC